MRQLIRTRREKEPHLSCGSCFSKATFTGSGSLGESHPSKGWEVQARSPQSRGQILGPQGWAGYGGEPKTQALEQTPNLMLCCHPRCAALGKSYDRSVPQLCFVKQSQQPTYRIGVQLI